MGIIALNRSEGGAKTGVFLDLHSSTPKHLYLTAVPIHEMMARVYKRAGNAGICASGYSPRDCGNRQKQALGNDLRCTYA